MWCEFHDVVVVSIEECKVFKENVQELIYNGLLTFEMGPNMVNDPLPG